MFSSCCRLLVLQLSSYCPLAVFPNHVSSSCPPGVLSPCSRNLCPPLVFSVSSPHSRSPHVLLVFCDVGTCPPAVTLVKTLNSSCCALVARLQTPVSSSCPPDALVRALSPACPRCLPVLHHLVRVDCGYEDNSGAAFQVYHPWVVSNIGTQGTDQKTSC